LVTIHRKFRDDFNSLKKEVRGRKISEGRFTGQYFKILPWQEEVLEACVDPSVQIIPITMSRGNGKTTFIANIACSAITPGQSLYRDRGQIPIIASSLDQGTIAFDHIKCYLQPRIDADREISGKLRYPWKSIDNSHQKELEWAPGGTKLKVRGSDPKRAHGLAPHFGIADEPAQWESGGKKMWSAFYTALGKQINGKILVIGTRPDSEEHWFHDLLYTPQDDVRSFLYVSDKDADPFDEENIRLSNPSYDHMPDLRKSIWADAERARKGGDDYNIYRALRLNLGTPEIADREYVISFDDWQAVRTQTPGEKEGPLFLAIDLGDGFSMTAFAAYWAATGRLEVHGAFPASPDLYEHGKIDYVGERYVRMHKAGELRIYPGTATNNQKFLAEMFDIYSKYDVHAISADKYKQTVTKQAIVSAQISKDIEFRRVGRGEDGNADVTAFQMDVRECHLNILPSLLMDSAIKEAVITRDTNGNAALNKSRHKGRIDGLQAAIQAVGMGRRWRLPEEGKRDFNVGDFFV